MATTVCFTLYLKKIKFDVLLENGCVRNKDAFHFFFFVHFKQHIKITTIFFRCTHQGPWVEGQEPNLVEQWAGTQDPDGHWMTGQIHVDQDLLLLKTSASSP